MPPPLSNAALRQQQLQLYAQQRQQNHPPTQLTLQHIAGFHAPDKPKCELVHTCGEMLALCRAHPNIKMSCLYKNSNSSYCPETFPLQCIFLQFELDENKLIKHSFNMMENEYLQELNGK